MKEIDFLDKHDLEVLTARYNWATAILKNVRERFAKAGVPMPDFTHLKSDEEINAMLAENVPK